MPAVMFYGDIKGQCTVEGYKEGVDLTSMSFGATRPVTSAAGTSKDRVSALAQPGSISLTKNLDNSDTLFFKEATSGKGTPVKIHVYKQGASGAEELLQLELTNSLVSQYNVSVGANGLPMVSMTIEYTKIEITQTSYTDEDIDAQPMRAGFDFAQGIPT